MLKISREIKEKSEHDDVPEQEIRMKRFKRDMGMMLTGLVLGTMLTGGAVAAGVMAEPSWQNIYVDGQQVQMEAYNINGSNYVKLRDIGQAVGFNVYWADGVQVDSASPYTGEASAHSAAKKTISIASVKGNTLNVGDRSGLIVGSGEGSCTVTSSDPAVVSVEYLYNTWVAVAKSAGTAAITASSNAGETGQLMLTVTGTGTNNQVSPPNAGIDLNANMEIRKEMVRLINQVRRENGVAELEVNEALMNAAQDCSAQGFTTHHNEYECRAALQYGYLHGFGDNLTVFTPMTPSDTARNAVSNWKFSPGHFQTMIAERYRCIGVGVTITDGRACCYMFAGNPNGHNPYE